MFAEVDRDARWLFDRRDLGLAAVLRRRLHAFDALLDLAHRVEILVDLAAVGRSQRALQLIGVRKNVVENALSVPLPLGAAGRILAGLEAREQALERRARIDLRRIGRRRGAPGDAVAVGAAIAGVAVADHASVLAAELDRSKLR